MDLLTKFDSQGGILYVHAGGGGGVDSALG